jgi:hypothetical protein
MLLPSPVELACMRGEQGRLCSRTEALVELSRATGVSPSRPRFTSPPGTCISSARPSVSS